MDYIFINIAELDNYILELIPLWDLVNLSQVNSNIFNIINKYNPYIQAKKIYLNFDINIFNNPVTKYAKYYLAACADLNKYLILNLNNKYNLSDSYSAGFIFILKTNNIKFIDWYHNKYIKYIKTPDYNISGIIKYLNINTIQYLLKIKGFWFFNKISHYNIYLILTANNFEIFKFVLDNYILQNLDKIVQTILKSKLIRFIKYFLFDTKIKPNLNLIHRFKNNLSLYNLDITELLDNYLAGNYNNISDYDSDEYIQINKINLITQLVYKLKSDWYKLNWYQLLCDAIEDNNLKLTEFICNSQDIYITEIKNMMELVSNPDITKFLIKFYGIKNICTIKTGFNYNYYVLNLQDHYLAYLFENNIKPKILLSEFVLICLDGTLEVVKYLIDMDPELIDCYKFFKYEHILEFNHEIIYWFIKSGILEYPEIKKYIFPGLNLLTRRSSKNYSDKLITKLIKLAIINHHNLDMVNPVFFNYICRFSRKSARLLYNNYLNKIGLVQDNIKIWLKL